MTVIPAEVRSHGPQTVEVRTPGGMHSAVANNLDDALATLERRVRRVHPDVVLQPRRIVLSPYGS